MKVVNQQVFMDEFGLSVPVVQGPMGGITGPELVAAVANAGALAMLPIWMTSIKNAVAIIKNTQQLTSRPFAVNLRADLSQLKHIEAAIDNGVSIIHLFWGDPGPSMSVIHSADVKVIATVDSVERATLAVDSGVTAVIAQGVEAGGHVLSDTPIEELLTSVLAVAGDVPVIAAGGCANGRDAKKLLAMGAAGVLFGTRFAVSEESEAHPVYKKALLDAGENSTVRSLCFDGMWPEAPHRTLINSTYINWNEAGRPNPGNRPGEGDVVMRTVSGQELRRYHVSTPGSAMVGDILAGAMYAGTGVARIDDCPGAATIVSRIAKELAS